MADYKMTAEDKIRMLEMELAEAHQRGKILMDKLESLNRAYEAKTAQVEELAERLGALEEEKEDFLALCEKKDKELAAASVYKTEYHALLDSLLHGGKMQ